MLTFTILSCLFLSLVQALPTMFQRDVVDPPITSPTASTVWHSGDTVTVTWDTSNINASQLTSPNGMLVLGWMANPTDSEHLMLDPPLAKNFPLIAGNVSFTVPSVVTRTNYIVVLFGDSGNISPTFTIDATKPSSSVQPTTSTVTIPTISSTSAGVAASSSASAPASSPPPASPSSEVSVTNTKTSVITESPSITASTVSIISSASSGVASISNNVPSSTAASGSSSPASTSTSAQAASNNAAASKMATHQSRQVLAFVVAGLLAAYLF
ncbi:hypothetical protein D9757_008474 [Collybiopsis confluens]|uniref:Ser-Thr-rich glycosyl-phosphatidyl-inositol-anchored membrane family-domain-containing protein n=1 Tax=Collybiopsis confluens TaxID=2823264 RepID=A0A8H5HEY0_9AGAR|nr:hypothetical protein D9757_008474 [Collybiopsis confluens]